MRAEERAALLSDEVRRALLSLDPTITIKSSPSSSHSGKAVVQTNRGKFFAKWTFGGPPRMYQCEAEGLRALHAVGKVRVNPALHATDAAELSLFIAEFVETSPIANHEEFGRALAEQHRAAVGDKYGFHHDNHIGMTRQENAWHHDWVDFFRERRLGYQLHLAEKNGHRGELQTLGRKLMDNLDKVLPRRGEPPTLIHGDLWSGNVIMTSSGGCLIDPAAYFGQREAELAMMRLFGGFPRAFHDAYNEVWPLAEGWRDRIDIYMLYHLLNHLNLFGASYHSQCVDILRRHGR